MSWQRGWGEMTPGTDARPVNRLPAPGLTRGRHDRAVKWVGVAVIALGLICGAGVSRAFGETIEIGGLHINGAEVPGTPVTIVPSEEPGVLAVVTMHNRSVNDPRDDGLYPLTLDNLTVQVRFFYNIGPAKGADRITVIVPPGITCEPKDCSVTLIEGFTGSVTLFDWRGM